ncbi:ParA family protein [Nocardia sp. XZ_19_369]|uniref:ParA family protein n=1 Tax=Nocardia sp. XZ_19_369 TaxID=2769487 RepID=UPI00188DD126|nr:ParA family protein [Nocardia sp. XZ_19_369]
MGHPLSGVAPTINWSALGNVIVVANWKGGVGKTATAVNLAARQASKAAVHDDAVGTDSGRPKRVLLVDLNGQGTASLLLGIKGKAGVDDDGLGLFQAIVTHTDLKPARSVGGRADLDLLPGGTYVSMITDAIGSRMKSAGGAASVILSLAERLQHLAPHYDVVIIDTPPENETLLLIALGVARFVLVPIKTDDSTRLGLLQLASYIRVAMEHNPFIMLLGVFVFGSGHSSKAIRAEIGRDVARDLGDATLVLKSFIRFSEGVAADSSRYGRVAEELSREIENNPSWVKRRRGEAKDSIVVSGASKGVAEDYDGLGDEVFALAEKKRAELVEKGLWP